MLFPAWLVTPENTGNDGEDDTDNATDEDEEEYGKEDVEENDSHSF